MVKTESMYLVIVGHVRMMEQLVNELNSKCKDPREKFVTTKISYPSAHKSLDLMKSLNNVEDESLLNSTTQKPVLVDDGVEYAQCHTYADGAYDAESYMLQIVTDNTEYYTLSFLKFPFGEDDNPDSVAEQWFRKNVDKVVSKKAVKLITVAGPNSDILVVGVKYE